MGTQGIDPALWAAYESTEFVAATAQCIAVPQLSNSSRKWWKAAPHQLNRLRAKCATVIT